MHLPFTKSGLGQLTPWLYQGFLVGMLGGLMMVLLAGNVSASEIYKSYDENGNVVYSDQPPTPDAEPIDLPEVNIVTSVPANPRPVNRSGDDDGQTPLALQMLSPNNEETFWGTSQNLEVSFDVQPEMRQGLQIAIYIDDSREAVIRTSRTTIKSIDRGTHTVRAELLDSRGNVLDEVGPRTFYMKQYSNNFN